MSRLFGKGVAIDTVKLKREMQDIARDTRDQAGQIARESLQGMIDAIQGKSAKRRTLVMKYRMVAWRLGRGTQDNPLEGAAVESDLKRNVRGSRKNRFAVYVVHKTKGVKKPVNLFDVLDAGVKDRTAKRRFRYPVANSNMFPSNFDADVFADARNAASALKVATIKFESIPAGKSGKAISVPKVVTVKAGDSVPGFKGKGLYDAVGRYVVKELVARGVVTKSRRTKVKLKQGDVVVKSRRVAKA